MHVRMFAFVTLHVVGSRPCYTLENVQCSVLC